MSLYELFEPLKKWHNSFLVHMLNHFLSLYLFLTLCHWQFSEEYILQCCAVLHFLITLFAIFFKFVFCDEYSLNC